MKYSARILLVNLLAGLLLVLTSLLQISYKQYSSVGLIGCAATDYFSPAASRPELGVKAGYQMSYKQLDLLGLPLGSELGVVPSQSLVSRIVYISTRNHRLLIDELLGIWGMAPNYGIPHDNIHVFLPTNRNTSVISIDNLINRTLGFNVSSDDVADIIKPSVLPFHLLILLDSSGTIIHCSQQFSICGLRQYLKAYYDNK